MAAAGDIAVEGRIDPDFHRRRSETGSGGGDFALYGAERFGGAERMNGEAAVTHHHVENLLVLGRGHLILGAVQRLPPGSGNQAL